MAKLAFKTKWVSAQVEKYEKAHEDMLSAMSPEIKQIMLEKEARRAWNIEEQDAMAKAYLKAIQDAQSVIIRQRVQNGDFEGMETLEMLMKQIKNKKGNGGNLNLHYMVTVNPKPGVTLAELQKKVNKYVKRKMVRQCEWVYEQRGSHEGELGKGMHVHMLVTQRGDTFDTQFHRNTRNTFKTLVGDPEKHVFITVCKEEWMDGKREYMKGAKTEEGKSEKVDMDRIWRPQNNLQEYYTYVNASQESARDTDSECAGSDDTVSSGGEV